jgi:two-component system sensor histidine kinase AlgZ
VPTLLLQPLAENAVRHGIEPMAAPGRIAVRVARRGDELVIEIFNTGSLAATTRGIGLTNTEERLGQLYGPGAAFTLREVEGGVLARISIPWSAAP